VGDVKLNESRKKGERVPVERGRKKKKLRANASMSSSRRRSACQGNRVGEKLPKHRIKPYVAGRTVWIGTTQSITVSRETGNSEPSKGKGVVFFIRANGRLGSKPDRRTPGQKGFLRGPRDL